MNTNEPLVAEIGVALNGTNGEKGLKTRVATLEAGRVDTFSAPTMKWLLGVLCSIIVGLGSAFAYVATHTTPPNPPAATGIP